jgi:hypothetical protein
MKLGRHDLFTLTLLCLLMLVMASAVSAAEKRIMIAVTGDTDGEINPCG